MRGPIVVGVVTLLGLSVVGSLHAQTPGRPGVVDVPASALTNPFTNPYANPFLNPAAAMQPMDRSALMLYWLKAQEARGGLGSGQMSGVRSPRGLAGSARATQTPSRVAEMPRSGMIPGAGAARYFRRGPDMAASRRAFFGRKDRYFGNNGH